MLGAAVLTGLIVAATAAAPPTIPPPATPRVTPASNTVICDKYCDTRDPALATSDRIGVAVTVGSRQFQLHLDDNDDMGWAAITGTQPGDQLWLDRSFDGGATWDTGSKLGATTTPSGYPGWRTLMYNVDDWNTGGVGLLRACGEPVGTTAISCTSWARTTWNASDRKRAAATALMEDYNPSTGLFNTTGWWNSANALTAIIDNVRVTGMGSYQYIIANTYQQARNDQSGDFTGEYLDDTGWWGLAWVDAYDLTGNSAYLSTAEDDANHMNDYWDGTCGGGIWWSTAKTYKNAIANALYIELNAALHNRISGDGTYLQRAQAGWNWYAASGMINSSNLINDGIDLSTCRNNGAPVYTYNQGVPLAALTELYKATGNASLLSTAQTLANASTTSTSLNANGILHDPGEVAGGGGADGPTFKGVYARDLGVLNAELSSHPYTAYLQRQANSAYANDRNSADQYGLLWAGPFDQTDAARQQSAVDLMNAGG
ncbi:MAG TPA: glycoside hydrolase family 76 protein [Pseudonocardiaceae bacterium]|jgi:predicted alpha-1,6-mannanase (GH76 family)|nr:glycoside hydrolase family 76 protein [Pseudonocardiaceae bacterium]